jgi:hypothetical protein
MAKEMRVGEMIPEDLGQFGRVWNMPEPQVNSELSTPFVAHSLCHSPPPCLRVFQEA